MSSSISSVENPSIQAQNAGSIGNLPLPISTYLSVDIVQRICSHFEKDKDILSFGSVNRYMVNVILLNDEIWASLLRKCFPDAWAIREPNKSLAIYKEQSTNDITQNILAGKFHVETLLVNQPVANFTIYCNKVYGVSSDGIHVWDLTTKKELQVLTGYPGTFYSIIVLDNQIIGIDATGVIPGAIKVLDLANGKELQTLQAKERITCIKANDNMIIAGLDSGKIKIWERTTGQELQPLIGHQKPITEIIFHRNKIISCSLDYTIKVWDPTTGAEVKTLTDDNNNGLGVRSITVSNNKIISAPHVWGKIRIWDLNSGKELYVLNNDLSQVYNILAHRNQIISCNQDGKIEVWDLNNGEKLKTIALGSSIDIYKSEYCIFYAGMLILKEPYNPNIWQAKFKFLDFNSSHH